MTIKTLQRLANKDEICPACGAILPSDGFECDHCGKKRLEEDLLDLLENDIGVDFDLENEMEGKL